MRISGTEPSSLILNQWNENNLLEKQVTVKM